MKAIQSRKSEQGFTIIELVVVILLLGILTATALPRFMDVTDEAHDAVVQGVLAGLNTSSGLYRATWYAMGQTSAVSSDYGLFPNTTGYAMGSDNSLTTIANTECETLFNNFLQAGRPTIGLVTGTGAITNLDLSVGSTDFLTAAKAGGDCEFAYIGQFVDKVALNNPIIIYDAGTGTFTLGTEL